MTNPNGTIPTSPALTSGVPAQPSIPNQSNVTPNIPPFTIDITPGAPPDQKTLVYSPDVQILIARNNKQYDVSADIVSVSVQRNENAASTLVFRLTNKDKRYNQCFERMDRVVCMMKRVTWIQTFSGYLDMVPHVQLYPGVVNFRATCTLKRVIHTWWDPGLPASIKIFDQSGLSNALNETSGGENANIDQGIGSTLRRFLVEVGGWSPQNIHVQMFPVSYFYFMQQQLQKSQKSIDDDLKKFKQLLLGDDITLASWGQASAQVGVNQGSYAIPQGDRQKEVIAAVDEMAMGPDNMSINASQGLNQAASVSTDPRDKAAWQDTSTVTQNWTTQGKQNDAAINCFMTIMVESSWTMYANNAVPESLQYPHEALSTDGTSVGLYQQTENNGWGSVSQRMNVRESTQMFLQRLNNLDWRNMDRGTACQSVQGSAYPARYAAQEQAAIQAVAALRGNQAPGSGGSPTTNPGGTPIPGTGATLPSVPGVAPNTNNLTAPLNAGTPQGAAAAATQRPQFDTQGAILYARSQIGKPYVWGNTGPDSYDCSGLTMMAYRSIGLDIGRVTDTQYNGGQPIPASQAKPGDLMFPGGPSQHVVMVSDTPGMIIEAAQAGVPIHEVPNYADPSTPCVHIPSATWGGPGAASFNPFPTGPGAAPGTVANGPNGTTATTSSKEPIARNLFTYMFISPPVQQLSMLLGAGPGEQEKAFINCQSMMPTLITMAKAGLRNFQSLPNGDLAFYYPDYFGLDGKKPVLTLRDIEMKNVQIDLNDDALCTHAYVSGSSSPFAAGGDMTITGWIQSQGFATVENEFLFRWMTKIAPNIKGESLASGTDIMKRFGVRPLTQEMTMIQHGAMEFLCAVQLFMQKWAEQYSTQVELTFMPELYPGQRILLDGHNLQVYVSQVTHNCDFENGFTTTATICAPSTPDMGNIIGGLVSVAQQSGLNIRDVIAQAATVIGG